MARPSTLPSLLAGLRTFLDDRQAEFVAAGSAKPSLPVTKEGKIHVRGLMKAFAEWAADRDRVVPSSVWQYCYTEEWKAAINEAAQAQGLKPIVSGEEAPPADDVVEQRLSRLAKDVKDHTEGEIQGRARIAGLERDLAASRAENRRLEVRLDVMQTTGALIRTAPVTE